MLDDTPLGIGRTANIYPWADNTVLKRFHDWVDDAAIESEARATRIAHTLGLDAPWVGEQLRVDGARALVFERIAGRAMLDLLVQPGADGAGFATVLAELHARLHAVAAPVELPEQLPRLRHALDKAELPSGLRVRVERRLAELPAGSFVCHGDFHPGNVMLGGPKPMVIDWNDATRGHPGIDLARTSVLLQGAASGTTLMPDQTTVINAFHTVYLARYFEIAPHHRAVYELALPVIAAARLSEGVEVGREWLLDAAACGARPD